MSQMARRVAAAEASAGVAWAALGPCPPLWRLKMELCLGDSDSSYIHIIVMIGCLSRITAVSLIVGLQFIWIEG